MLIQDDRIVWVGDDAAAEVYLDEHTNVIELAGAFVAPPFIDAAYVPGTNEPNSGSGCSMAIELAKDPTAPVDANWPRLLTVAPSEAELAELLALHESGKTPVTVCLDPGLAQTARELARAGIPFCFGSWGKYASPWEWISLATGTSDAPGLSERAAFLAATRGALRVFPEFNWQTDAMLTEGAAADFAVWHADVIAVRAADPRIAAWSTDPRSGVAGLPEFTHADSWPNLQALYLRGELQPSGESVALQAVPAHTPPSERR